MTDRKAHPGDERLETERLYNSFVSDFFDLSELSDAPVKSENADQNNDIGDFDDDLFDADCDDFEIDDYDDKGDDIIIPGDLFKEDTLQEPEVPVQPSAPVKKTEANAPAHTNAPSLKSVEKIPAKEVSPSEKQIEKTPAKEVFPQPKSITDKPTPPVSDIRAVSDIPVKPDIAHDIAHDIAATPNTPSGQPNKSRPKPDTQPKSPEKAVNLQKSKKTISQPKAEKAAPSTASIPSATANDLKRKAAIDRRGTKTVGKGAPYSTLPVSVQSLSLDFLPALLPILIWAVFVFGARVLMISAISVLSCVIFELWFEYLIRKRVTVGDLSAVSDGLLISLLMPASVPLWIPIIAAFFGTVVIKCLFGGRGRSLLQPSLAGFAFVSLLFRDALTSFTKPLSRLPVVGVDESVISELGSSYSLSAVSGQNLTDLPYTDMIIGLRTGSIGEISVLLIATALIYLLVRRVITWHVPVSFIAVSGVLFYLMPNSPLVGKFVVIELLCGIIPLCAVFFASDFTVSPIFGMSKIIYGGGCGALTVLFRYLGLGIHSAVYAVLIMTLLARPLDMLFVPRPKRKKT